MLESTKKQVEVKNNLKATRWYFKFEDSSLTTMKKLIQDFNRGNKIGSED